MAQLGAVWARTEHAGLRRLLFTDAADVSYTPSGPATFITHLRRACPCVPPQVLSLKLLPGAFSNLGQITQEISKDGDALSAWNAVELAPLGSGLLEDLGLATSTSWGVKAECKPLSETRVGIIFTRGRATLDRVLGPMPVWHRI